MMAKTWTGSVIAIIGITQIQTGFAQSMASKPGIEVASIRPFETTSKTLCDVNTTPLNLLNRFSGGTLTLSRFALGGMIRSAYHIRKDQLAELPRWGECDFYNVKIKLLENGSMPSEEDLRLILQKLLADRFNLQMRHEMRNQPVYELAIAKKGIKLTVLPERSAKAQDPWNIIPLLVQQYLDLPVIDKTDVKGFVVDQKWDAIEALGEELRHGGTPAPSIFSAVEEFGLTLRRTNQEADFFTIEHVERPSEN